jgi:HEAT repeats
VKRIPIFIGAALCAVMLATLNAVAWPPSSPAKQDFDVQMKITKTRIILGEPVWVDVRITNQSSETLLVDTSAYCFMFDTRPLNVQIPAAQPGNGERDRRWNEHPGGDCFYTQADMKPGETLTKRYVLSGDFRIIHPGRYSVLLEKAIHYAQAPNAPPAGAAEKYTRLDQLQAAQSQISLDVLPANPEKLLAIEQDLAREAANPVPIPPPPPAENGRPVSPEDLDNQRKQQQAAFDARYSLAEGLAAYPAARMEQLFRAWLQRGDLESYAMTALYHLNTAAAREVLAQVAESSAKPDDAGFQSQRRGSVYALARMDDKSYVPLLEKLTRDANHEVERQAILGLGMLGGEKELPFLTTLAREGATMPDRQDAIMSMGDTASLKAIPILIDLIVLPDSDQPSASTVALSRLTHHYLPTVDRRSLLETQAAWQDWWKQNQRTVRVYGPFEDSNGNAEPAAKK